MPVVRFELNDGRIAKFDVREGMTAQEIQQQVGPQLEKLNAEGAAPKSVDDFENMGALEVAGRGFIALPGSVGEELSNVAQAVMSPIETAKSLLTLGEGAIRLAIPGGDDPSEDAARAVGKYYTDRYGSLAGFKEALATEPASVLSDIAVPLSGGAALAAKAPGTVGKLGKLAATAASSIDPVTSTAKLASKVASPTLSKAAKLLQAEGVILSPGQTMGGAVKGVEDRLSGQPLVGDVIQGATGKGIEEFNRAAYNRALKPIGKSADKMPVGTDGIAAISRELDKAYNKILPKVKLEPSAALFDNVREIVSEAAVDLSKEELAKLNKIVTGRVVDKLKTGQTLDGEAIKVMQSNLRVAASRMSKSPLPGDGIIGDALNQISGEIRQSLIDFNPKYAEELKDVDTAYANYTILRKAGQSTADQSGGFTPAQLHGAVKAGDNSVAKGDFARGRALMQDLSEAGVEVLPNKVPDSGTAGRAVTALILGGGATIEPITASLVALGLTPFVARKTAQTILSRRPKTVRQIGAILNKVDPKIAQSLQQSGRAANIVEQEENKQ